MSEPITEHSNEQNRLKLARMALENKNGEEAIKYSTEVLEMNSENAEAWMIKGTASAYVAKGMDAELRYKEAMSCLDRAKELDPTLTEVEIRREEVKKLICKFLCLLGTKLWNQAVQITNIYMKSGLGGYSKAGNLPEQAVQYYERALAIDPMYREALKSVIHIRKETGKVELATSHIERMRKLDSNFDSPSNRVGPQMMDNLASVNQGLTSIVSIGLAILALLFLFVAMSKGCR
jgi:tetratricopeptide (TPR) repeat protein